MWARGTEVRGTHSASLRPEKADFLPRPEAVHGNRMLSLFVIPVLHLKITKRLFNQNLASRQFIKTNCSYLKAFCKEAKYSLNLGPRIALLLPIAILHTFQGLFSDP